MPHYANGRKARILDVVRGRNHTFKHEIVGVLIHINSQSEKCNGIVACVGGAGNFYLPTSSGVEYRANEDRSGLEPANPNGQPPSGIMATNAYADLDQLVALDVNTGEVLEVEEAEVAEPEPAPAPESTPESAPEPTPDIVVEHGTADADPNPTSLPEQPTETATEAATEQPTSAPTPEPEVVEAPEHPGDNATDNSGDGGTSIPAETPIKQPPPNPPTEDGTKATEEGTTTSSATTS